MKDTGALALNRSIEDFRRHVKILEQLKEPMKSFSSILIELMADKLDVETFRVWVEAHADEDPTFTDMMAFLEKRVKVLETLAIEKCGAVPKKPIKTKVSLHAATTHTNNVPVFVMCKKNGHSIASCNVFKGTNTQERMRVVSEKRLCRNCLKAGHLAHAYASKYKCQQCSQRHHTLLHALEENSSVLVGETSSSSTMALASSKKSSVNTVLSTVLLVVVDAYGKEHLARALLDNGSQPHAISEHL